METKDLIVIGGGINGAGIAVDAAGRGLSVLMLEANDLACATSSASSKLIHGGLRYLEHYEFRLVSEALAERAAENGTASGDSDALPPAPSPASASGVDDPYWSVYVRSSGYTHQPPGFERFAFWLRIGP